MEHYQELQHWGIKGMKWGIRRYQNEDGTLTEAGKKRYQYQNPDGSLTEEGKKNYMTGAKKGKIDPKKLSDADLNMINSRFARERTFNENIQKYKESTFSYKLEKAVLDRIKGNNNNGGGGGKKGGKGGGNSLKKLLTSPITKAFAEAFKTPDGNDGNDGKKERKDQEEKVAHFIFSGGKGNVTISDFISGENDHIATAKKYMGADYSRPVHNENTGNWNTTRNNTAADVLRSRNGYTTERARNDWENTSNKRKKKMKNDAKHWDESVYTHFAITRASDELMH